MVFYILARIKPHQQSRHLRLQNNTQLVSKRVFIDNPNDILINFVPLREDLQNLLKQNDDTVSLYFEYLPSGTSIGINERNEIRLASLSKIPTAMAIYSKIEKGKLSKDDTITLDDKHIDATFGTLYKKGAGSEATLGEIMEHAITESDNTAQNVLLSLLTPEEINSVFEYLDIPFKSENNYPIISAKNYSSILRSLYLSSFVGYESSQEILNLMTQSIYTDKIPAGVPKDIPVAHKIGVFETEEQSQESTFSDCGIVYVPKRPYILCIMTRGTDEFTQNTMRAISKTIYDYVSKGNSL